MNLRITTSELKDAIAKAAPLEDGEKWDGNHVAEALATTAYKAVQTALDDELTWRANLGKARTEAFAVSIKPTGVSAMDESDIDETQKAKLILVRQYFGEKLSQNKAIISDIAASLTAAAGIAFGGAPLDTVVTSLLGIGAQVADLLNGDAATT